MAVAPLHTGMGSAVSFWRCDPTSVASVGERRCCAYLEIKGALLPCYTLEAV